MRVLQQVFYYAKAAAEPSCRTPKVLQNSGEGLASFEDWLLTLPKEHSIVCNLCNSAFLV